MSKIIINPKLNIKLGNNITETRSLLPQVVNHAQRLDEGLAVLSRLDPSLPTSKMFSDALKESRNTQEENEPLDLNKVKYEVAVAMSSTYTMVSSERKRIIMEVDRMRSFYLVDTILNQVTEDALTPEVSTGKILKISSKKPKIQKELDKLQKRINFDQLLKNTVPEMCAYGEYTYRVHLDSESDDEDIDRVYKDQINPHSIRDEEDDDDDTKAKGVIAIRDIVDQTRIISLSEDGKSAGYLFLGYDGRLYHVHASYFVKFTLGGQRLRIDLGRELMLMKFDPDDIMGDKNLFIPRVIRMGKSMLYPVLGKLKELELLEKLVPATKLNKLSAGTVIGLNVPDSYDIEKALNAIKRVEGLINKKVGVDAQSGDLTIEAIMATAGRYKVIPIFGDKGQMSEVNYKSNEPDELLSSVDTIRSVVLDSIGMPSELIYKSSGDGKKEILKRYARYLRRLKNVQRSGIDGCRQIIDIHLQNIEMEYEDSDIQIEFLNKLVEIDNLDKLEHMDITVSMLTNLTGFLETLQSKEAGLGMEVNMGVAIDYIEAQLNTIGLKGLLTKSNKPKPVNKFSATGLGDFSDDDAGIQDDPEDGIDADV